MILEMTIIIIINYNNNNNNNNSNNSNNNNNNNYYYYYYYNKDTNHPTPTRALSITFANRWRKRAERLDRHRTPIHGMYMKTNKYYFKSIHPSIHIHVYTIYIYIPHVDLHYMVRYHIFIGMWAVCFSSTCLVYYAPIFFVNFFKLHVVSTYVSLHFVCSHFVCATRQIDRQTDRQIDR